MSDPFVTPSPVPGEMDPAPDYDAPSSPSEAPDLTPLPDSDPGDRPVDGSVMAAGDDQPD